MHIFLSQKGKEKRWKLEGVQWFGRAVTESWSPPAVPESQDFLLMLSVEAMRGMGTATAGGKNLLSQHLPPIFPIKRHWQWDKGFFLITTYGIKKLISSWEPNPALCCLDCWEQMIWGNLFSSSFCNIGKNLMGEMSVVASVVSWPKGGPVTWILQIPVGHSRYIKTAPPTLHSGSLTSNVILVDLFPIYGHSQAWIPSKIIVFHTILYVLQRNLWIKKP